MLLERIEPDLGNLADDGEKGRKRNQEGPHGGIIVQTIEPNKNKYDVGCGESELGEPGDVYNCGTIWTVAIPWWRDHLSIIPDEDDDDNDLDGDDEVLSIRRDWGLNEGTVDGIGAVAQ